MLQVGRLGCSTRTSGCPMPALHNWTRTHFAAFCIVSSPLVLSIHPSDENLAPILDIIGNKGAMASLDPPTLHPSLRPSVPPSPLSVFLPLSSAPLRAPPSVFSSPAALFIAWCQQAVNQAWAGHPGTLVKTLPPAPSPTPSKVSTSWEVFPNTTNIYDRVPKPNADSGTVHFLGVFPTTDACFAAANASGASKGPFHSFTYSHQTARNGAFSGHCYADTSMVWQGGGAAAGRGQVGTDSGRGPGFPLTPPAKQVAGVQFWAKPLGNGKTAVLFINGGDLPYPNASVALQELNVTGAVTATDVWTGDAVGGVAGGSWSPGVVAPYDSKFVVLTAA